MKFEVLNFLKEVDRYSSLMASVFNRSEDNLRNFRLLSAKKISGKVLERYRQPGTCTFGANEYDDKATFRQ